MQAFICARCHSYMRGFTLVELMITMAIAGIMLAIAVPSFRIIMLQNRVAATTNQLLSGLRLARSEAVTRGKTVTIATTGTGWGDGWVIFVDDNKDGAFGSGEQMIKIRQSNGEQSDMTVVGNSVVASAVSFNSTGKKVGNQGGTITIRAPIDSTPEHDIVTTVTINRVGRVYSQRED